MSAAADTSTKLRGFGGYGVVWSPALPNENGVHPDEVTKMFFHKRQLDSALASAERMRSIMKPTINRGHRVTPYTKRYTLKNLPANVLTPRVMDVIPNRDPDKELFLVRMPDMGVDLHKVHQEALSASASAGAAAATASTSIRSRPFHTILLQIQKLIHQVAALAAAGVGHFDVRQANIMILPETGEMTLVDFDWLKPLPELFRRYPFGFYSNPPEALFLRRLFPVQIEADDSPKTTAEEVLGELATKQQMADWFWSIVTAPRRSRKGGAGGSSSASSSTIIQTFVHQNVLHHGADEAAMTAEVLSANVENIKLMRTASDVRQFFLDHSLPTFDSYGLGTALLVFLQDVFPFDAASISKTASRLITLIPHRSGDELTTIAITVQELARLFMRMTDMTLSRRWGPAKAVTVVDKIVRTFEEDIVACCGLELDAELARLPASPPSSPENAAAAAAATGGAATGSGAAATGGASASATKRGGARRKTIRRRKQR